MSDTTNTNIPNPNEGNGGAAQGQQQNGKKEEKKQFFLVRWGKAAIAKTKEAVDAVKEHPVLVAVSAALGTAAGGYATYKVMSHVSANAEPTYAPPMIPAGEDTTEEQDSEEETSTNEVEYVDIPEK